MQTCLKLISALILLSFIYCRTNELDTSATNVFPKLIPYRNSYLLGDWTFQSTIWDQSRLSLRGNHTFTYSSNSCLGLMFTEGSWKSDLDGVILTSRQEFKDKQGKAIVSTSQDTNRLYLKNARLVYKDASLHNNSPEIFLAKVLRRQTINANTSFMP